MAERCPVCGKADCGRGPLARPILGEWPDAHPPRGARADRPRTVNVIVAGRPVRRILEPEAQP